MTRTITGETKEKGQKTNSLQEPKKQNTGPSRGSKLSYPWPLTRSNNNESNLVEFAVVRNKNRFHYQVGSGLSDPVPTNAPSKKPCFGVFFMRTWRWVSLGWVKDFSPSPSSCPWEGFFKRKILSAPSSNLPIDFYLPPPTYLPYPPTYPHSSSPFLPFCLLYCIIAIISAFSFLTLGAPIHVVFTFHSYF